MKKLWNKDFVLLLQGSTVSTLGDLMYSVAIGFWVYEKTGSSALMGVMSAISMFVTMFLSPFCGSIVDKLNRKWVMVGLDLMQSAVTITVGIFAYTNKLSIAGVLIAAFLPPGVEPLPDRRRPIASRPPRFAACRGFALRRIAKGASPTAIKIP